MCSSIKYYNDEYVQNAVHILFIGIVPERKEDLVELYNKYNPCFNILPEDGDDGKMVIDGGLYRHIRYNHRAMRAIWVSAFAAWEGFRAFYNNDYKRFKMLLDYVKIIISAFDIDSIPYPHGIPNPGMPNDNQEDDQMQAARDLAIFAGGWFLLHEVRHTMHQQDGTSSSEEASTKKHEEELSCDLFATDFILKHVDKYCDSTGYCVDSVKEKRMIGVFFALFSLTVLSHGRWQSSESHPSVQDRINSVSTRIQEDSPIGSRCKNVVDAAFNSLNRVWPMSPRPEL